MLDLAELADGAVGWAENRSGRCIERARVGFQGAGEKRIEVFEGRRVFDLRFAHVDLVLPGEPGDQAILEPAQAAFGGVADQPR
ncbi:hypothetical protein D9M68_538590 [compost metagenome]